MSEPPTDAREPIQHRPPTEATVKQLYATAYSCAKPSCRQPLYRINPDTGEYILNSRVAHIHARSENGPRWDPDMSESDNRASANLLLLCEQHASEIDATPKHFTPEALRRWKSEQLAEHLKVNRQWTPNHEEIDEVRRKSFGLDAAKSHPPGSAELAETARAIGTLIAAALDLRSGPEQVAAEWRRRRTYLNGPAFPPIYDFEGERLYVEVSSAERDQFTLALRTQLAEVRSRLQPLVGRVASKLDALAAVTAGLNSWISWVRDTVDALLRASETWPHPGYAEDDGRVPDAVAQINEARQALNAAWRGEPATPPPDPVLPEPPASETPTERALREHTELLKTARPWARVSHRPFDADLYADLVAAAGFARHIPPVVSSLGFELSATAGLAAAVARNADDATFAALIEQAANLQPLVVAVEVLHQLQSTATDKGHESLADDAHRRMRELLGAVDWTQPAVWESNGLQTGRLLWMTATSTLEPEELAARITNALDREPRLLHAVLNAAATWIERHSTAGEAVTIATHIRDVPPWLPVERLVAEIQAQRPHVSAARFEDEERYQHHDHNLAAQLLRAAEQTDQ